MSTKCDRSTALCTGTTLIVAGGRDMDWCALQTVEVLNTKTLQWFTAADLPQLLSYASAAICDDQIYILGESNMYTSSLPTLIQSCKSFISYKFKGRRC